MPWLSGYRSPARPFRMLVLAVWTPVPNQRPSVTLNQADHVTDFPAEILQAGSTQPTRSFDQAIFALFGWDERPMRITWKDFQSG